MFKISGLEELQNKLGDLARKSKELDGQHSVPVSELLTPNFVSQHTSFSSADEMFKASGFNTETQEEFGEIPDDDWDSYIRSISSFDCWQSMLAAAGQEWAKQKLGL